MNITTTVERSGTQTMITTHGTTTSWPSIYNSVMLASIKPVLDELDSHTRLEGLPRLSAIQTEIGQDHTAIKFLMMVTTNTFATTEEQRQWGEEYREGKRTTGEIVAAFEKNVGYCLDRLNPDIDFEMKRIGVIRDVATAALTAEFTRQREIWQNDLILFANIVEKWGHYHFTRLEQDLEYDPTDDEVWSPNDWISKFFLTD